MKTKEVIRLQQIAGLKQRILLESDSTSPWGDSDYKTGDEDLEELLAKYNLDLEWAYKFLIDLDGLGEEELADLDYVEDRIQAHLSMQGANDSQTINEYKSEDIVNFLLSTTDGPVNIDTVIGRAIDVAWEHQSSKDEIANAVFEAMEILREEGGTLDSSEY